MIDCIKHPWGGWCRYLFQSFIIKPFTWHILSTITCNGLFCIYVASNCSGVGEFRQSVLSKWIKFHLVRPHAQMWKVKMCIIRQKKICVSFDVIYFRHWTFADVGCTEAHLTFRITPSWNTGEFVYLITFRKIKVWIWIYRYVRYCYSYMKINETKPYLPNRFWVFEFCL